MKQLFSLSCLLLLVAAQAAAQTPFYSLRLLWTDQELPAGWTTDHGAVTWIEYRRWSQGWSLEMPPPWERAGVFQRIIPGTPRAADVIARNGITQWRVMSINRANVLGPPSDTLTMFVWSDGRYQRAVRGTFRSGRLPWGGVE